MTAPTTSREAQVYLAAVEAELADLPEDDRRELLDDLASHLAELEDEADGRTLEARLGRSRDYASELRSAAGLPARRTDSTGRGRAALDLAWRRGGSRAVREVGRFVPQLRPAWWVLRGYLVVLVPSLWVVNGERDFPFPALFGSHALGLLTVVAAITASVAVGHRTLTWLGRAGVVAVNVALIVGAGNLIADAPWRLAERNVVIQAAPLSPFADSPLVSRHGPVTNVLPYSQDGRPLEGVLLYDQDGRPLLSGMQLWWADRCRRVLAQPRAADGVPVPHSYPQQYVLDPSGVTVSGQPVTAGQCTSGLVRPLVSVPVFPKPSLKP